MSYSWFNTSSFHPSMRNNILDYWVIILSHVFNLLPMLLAFNRPLPSIYKAIIVFQTIFSIIYHAFPNKRWPRILDWLFATSLILSNLIVFVNYNSVLEIQSKIIIVMPIIILAFILFFKFDHYTRNHSLWHVLSAIVTSIVIW